MTFLALPSDDIVAPITSWIVRLERSANLGGALLLLPGLMLGAAMFFVQSF